MTNMSGQVADPMDDADTVQIQLPDARRFREMDNAFWDLAPQLEDAQDKAYSMYEPDHEYLDCWFI